MYATAAGTGTAKAVLTASINQPFSTQSTQVNPSMRGFYPHLTDEQTGVQSLINLLVMSE